MQLRASQHCGAFFVRVPAIGPVGARSVGGVGRIGGIVFPFLGGVALASALPLETIMLLAAIPAVAIAVLVAVLGVVNGGQIDARASAKLDEPDAV